LSLFAPVRAIADGPQWAEKRDEHVVQTARPQPPTHWIDIPAPFVHVLAEPGDRAAATRLSRRASERLRELAERLRVPVGDTVYVYLTPDDEVFRSLQPSRAPMWADATAYPGSGAIYLRAQRARVAGDEPIEQVLDHELVHILVGRAFAPNRPPSWLQEGYAQVFAGQQGPETTRTILRGRVMGGLIPFSSLMRGFPPDPVQADLAYAQSADLMAWLMVQHGEEVLPELLLAMRGGASTEVAFRKVTGSTLSEAEKAWRATLEESDWPSLAWFLEDEVLFAIAGVALLIGGVLRRRRFHLRLRQMDARERWQAAVLERVWRHRRHDDDQWKGDA
jgi:hypothetical protein